MGGWERGLIFKDTSSSGACRARQKCPNPTASFRGSMKGMGTGSLMAERSFSTALCEKLSVNHREPLQSSCMCLALLRTCPSMQSDPVQGKDTAWVGQNDGSKFWSLLPGGSGEVVLVWPSCLGDAPALSWQPETSLCPARCQ